MDRRRGWNSGLPVFVSSLSLYQDSLREGRRHNNETCDLVPVFPSPLGWGVGGARPLGKPRTDAGREGERPWNANGHGEGCD